MSGYLPAALMNRPMMAPPAPPPGAFPPGVAANGGAPIDPWLAVGYPVSVSPPANDPWDAVGVQVDSKGEPVAKKPQLVPVTDPDVIKQLNAMPESGPWDKYKPQTSDDQDGPWKKYQSQGPNPFDQFDDESSAPPTQTKGANPFDQFDEPNPSTKGPRLVPVHGDPFAQAPASGRNLESLVSGAQDPNAVPAINSPQAAAQVQKLGNTGYYFTPAEMQELDARQNDPWFSQLVHPVGGWSGAARRMGAVLGDDGRAMGSLFGLGDRAAATVEGNSDTYQGRLAEQQQASADAMQRLGLLGKFYSGVGDTAGAAAVLPEALMGGGATLAGKVVGGAAGGGALGLTAGAAQTPAGATWQEMGANALLQGGEGAVLGGVAPAVAGAVGKLVGAGAQKVADAYYGLRYGGDLPANVADPILAGLGQQGQNVGQAQQRMQQLGAGSTLADTGSALEGQANRLANRDIATQPTIENNLRGRLDTLDQRVPAAVDQHFGPDVNAPQMVQALKQQTAANAKTAYDPVFANAKPVDVSPVLQKIDSALKPGGPGMTGSGVSDPYIDTLRRIRGYIAGQGSQAFDMQTLHNAQQLINDAGRSANQAGNGYQAGQIWGLRKDLMQQMDAANPGYLNATKQYSTDKSIQEAFDDGRNILATRQDGTVFDPDLLKQNLDNMSAPEQQAYQVGARKALTDVMGQARSDPAGLRTRLANDNGYAVGKLRQVFGDDAVNGMLQELDSQATMRGTNNAVLGNSATAYRQAADSAIPGFGQEAGSAKAAGHGSLPLSIMAGVEMGRHLGGMINNPEAGAALGMVAGPILSKGAQKVTEALAASRGIQQDAARAGLARALTTEGRQNVFEALSAREASRPGVQRAGDQARRLMNAYVMQQGAQGVGDPLSLVRRQLGIQEPARAVNP